MQYRAVIAGVRLVRVGLDAGPVEALPVPQQHHLVVGRLVRRATAGTVGRRQRRHGTVRWWRGYLRSRVALVRHVAGGSGAARSSSSQQETQRSTHVAVGGRDDAEHHREHHRDNSHDAG